MKFIPFLMALLVVLPSFSYALTYDLQPYTTCNNGLCQTSVDVTTLGLNAQRTNALKTVNITNFLTKSGIINNFAYNWNGNILTLSGQVYSDVYWTFSAGGDLYDPYWNFTTQTTYNMTVPALTQTLGRGVNTISGVEYKANSNQTINNMTLSSTTATNLNCYIWNATNGYLKNATASTRFVNFSNFNITAGTYRFMCDVSSGNMGYQTGVSNASLTFTLGNFTGAVDCNPSCGSPTAQQINVVQSVIATSTTQNSVYYTTNLYLNGIEGNITMDNATALSIVAYNNLTLNSSIYINGTLKNNTVSNATYLTNLSSGLYNITGYYFNASTNSMLTYWANVTYTPPAIPPVNVGITTNINLDLNNAPLTCFNSTHAVRNSTVQINGNLTTLSELYLCQYGCDTVLNICKPSPFWTYIIFLVIIFIIIFIMYKVVEWL